MARRKRVIGIIGGSGSGKTTLAREIENRTKGVVIVSMDMFYKDISYMSDEEIAGVNFDEPAAKDYNEFMKLMKNIETGGTLRVPVYDFIEHKITKYEEHNNAEVVIIEGWDLGYAIDKYNLKNKFDLTIYVNANDSERLARRLLRDRKERGINEAQTVRQWRRDVLPGHKKYVEPYRLSTDMIIHSEFGRLFGVVVDIIIAWIET